MSTSLLSICGPKELSIDQSLLFSAYDTIGEDMLTIIEKAYSADQRGKKIGEDLWDQVNDINYLIVYFYIIRNYIIANDLTSTSDINDTKDTYKIDCIRKHFACFGFDIDPLLNVYGIVPGSTLGIDYAELETGDNPFEIL